MSHTERSTEIPFPRTGILATLRAFLRTSGSSAPSSTPLPRITGAERPHLPASLRARRRTVIATAALAATLALLAPAPSFAAFTRPFLRQLTETPAGPFQSPAGLAVDAEDDLWVSELGNPFEPPFKLDRFAPAYPPGENSFLETLEIEPPEPSKLGYTAPYSLAIDRSNSTYHFYVTGNFHEVKGTGTPFPNPYVEVFDASGAFVRRFGPFSGAAHVALDNSTEPSAGTVYVADDNGVHKFNAAGEPVSFSGSAPYISANEIVGRSGPIAVDSQGDIYVGAEEYGPSGVAVQAFDGNQTPGLGGSHEVGGFGGEIEGVAADSSLSGHTHLLLSVRETRLGAVSAIDEFDVTTGRFLGQLTESAPGHPLPGAPNPAGLQVAVDSHGDLYLADRGSGDHSIYAWGEGRFQPGLRLAEATQRKPTSAVLGGSVNPEALVNPEESGLSDCRFEYVTETEFQAEGFSGSGVKSAECEPPAASIPADEAFHPVQAEVTGLVSGTTYRFRLSATTAGPLGGTAASSTLAFTALHAPRIDSTTVDNLSSTFADLRAQISPLGADTAYQFQYLSEAEYAENGNSFAGPHAPTAAPAVPADIGPGGPSGGASESVLEHIGGLQAATAYRLRVLATNECEPEHPGKVCATEGEAAAFTTLPRVSPGLPDSRAYELLTPPDKGSAADMFALPDSNYEFINRDIGFPSVSGNRFLLNTRAAFGPFPASLDNSYVFSRDPSLNRWTYTSLASPSLGLQSLTVGVFDPSLSQVGFGDGVGSGGSAAGVQNLTLLGPPGGPYTTLHADAAFQLGSEPPEQTQLVGASHDLSRVFVESNNHALAPPAEGQDEGSQALYEYSAGSFSLVNVNSKGALLSPCGAVLGGGTHEGVGLQSRLSEGLQGKTHAAVSADGSRAVFTAPDPTPRASDGPGCWNGAGENAPQLYTRSAGATLELSKPEASLAAEKGRYFAHYVGASTDGSRVFFIDEAWLTADHPEAGHDTELYEWRSEGTAGPKGACEKAAGCLTRVSVGESGHAAAAVFAAPAVSADGSAIYFLANGVLASNAGADGTHASPGGCAGGESFGICNLYRYDTATGATVYATTIGKVDWNGGQLGIGVGLPTFVGWETTPDGRYLLFTSVEDLTGYSSGPAPGAKCALYTTQGAFGTCSEVYRYDAATANLACVSCDPSGAPPVSNAEFGRSGHDPPPAAGPPLAISGDGSYAFFDTADALVPQDTNGTLDVYEWHEGTISLISSGHDSAPSFFLGASPDGSNVFFGTHARLVPADTDTAGDLYDARICTASDPCIKPPLAKEGLCEGDACSHPLPPPARPTLSTSVASGPGNVTECPRGKILKAGKCVRKHHKKAHHKAKQKRAANTNRRAGR